MSARVFHLYINVSNDSNSIRDFADDYKFLNFIDRIVDRTRYLSDLLAVTRWAKKQLNM